MMPAELREKVARAICPGCDGHHLDCSAENCVAYQHTDAALAVVREAMREPDAGALKAFHEGEVIFAEMTDNYDTAREFNEAQCRVTWPLLIAASPLRDAP